MSVSPSRLEAVHTRATLSPILLAEDGDDDTLLFSHLLTRAHIPNPVIRCRHGREAILRLIELWAVCPCGEWPRLLFLDRNMPVMDGFAVLQWLRERPVNHGLRTVMLSMSDHPGDIQQAKELGAAGYLVKYPAVECLAAIVKSALATNVASVDARAAPVREVPSVAFEGSPGFGPAPAAFHR